jgi:hypothetical protein
MGRKLRVFVSSTMKDMRNERFAVLERLSSFNFEPVNAEGWGPVGTKSWPRIQSEIESSDIFVLILGSRYGWMPDKGPKGGLGLSVTHLELKQAQELGIPVLPFLKRLEYDEDRTSEDAKKRDAFRDEIQNWEDGYFTTEFELATDLADSVGQSLIGLLTNEFQRTRVQERSSSATQFALALAQELPKQDIPTPSIPVELIDAVSRRNAILFAGSGISLAAGLPGASAFAQSLIRLLRESDPNYSVNPTGAAFAGIATDLEASRGRQYLVRAITDLIHPPQGIEPTVAHLNAVKLFDRILTTNYDELFELAASRQEFEATLVADELQGSLPQRTIVKLHGSANAPESLLLTERDVFMFDRSRPRLWAAVQAELQTNMVVVVGASLRDPSIVRFFSEVGEGLHGYFVVPYLWEFTPERVRYWNLQCIQTDADTFMAELSAKVR